MTIPEAIATVSPAMVNWMLMRGESFERQAKAEHSDGWRSHADAYETLALADGAEVRAELAAIDSLTEAALEGSTRALQGLRERGLELPRDCRYAGAWL
jgi:hypothetical protein